MNAQAFSWLDKLTSWFRNTTLSTGDSGGYPNRFVYFVNIHKNKKSFLIQQIYFLCSYRNKSSMLDKQTYVNGLDFRWAVLPKKSVEKIENPMAQWVLKMTKLSGKYSIFKKRLLQVHHCVSHCQHSNPRYLVLDIGMFLVYESIFSRQVCKFRSLSYSFGERADIHYWSLLPGHHQCYVLVN